LTFLAPRPPKKGRGESDARHDNCGGESVARHEKGRGQSDARRERAAACQTTSVSSISAYGSSNQKRVPRPTVLSTWICSPCACRIWCTMLNPSPVPPLRRERSGSTL